MQLVVLMMLLCLSHSFIHSLIVLGVGHHSFDAVHHGRDGRFIRCPGAMEWLELAVDDDAQRQGTAYPTTPKP